MLFILSAFVNYPIVFSFAVDFSGVDIPSSGTVGLILDIDVNIQPADEIVKLCGKDVDERRNFNLSIGKCARGNCVFGDSDDEYCNGKSNQIELTLERTRFDEEEISVQKLLNMTGMQLSWRYTQDVKIHHANNDSHCFQ